MKVKLQENWLNTLCLFPLSKKNERGFPANKLMKSTQENY